MFVVSFRCCYWTLQFNDRVHAVFVSSANDERVRFCDYGANVARSGTGCLRRRLLIIASANAPLIELVVRVWSATGVQVRRRGGGNELLTRRRG